MPRATEISLRVERLRAAFAERSRRLAANVVEIFLKRVVKSNGDGCWEWSGKRFDEGYGKFSMPGNSRKTVQAHRLSYELFVGPIPDGLLICHKCDNPPCVRPDHLFPGTSAQNTQDAIAKGRMAVGEANPRATITEADVREIRRRYAAAPLSPNGKRKRNGVLPGIAQSFGISYATANDIVRWRTWSHLTDEEIQAEVYEPATAMAN